MNRYRPYYFDPWKQTGHDAEMRQNTTGGWVRFEDHEQAMRVAAPLKGGVPVREWQLQQENERLREFVEDLAGSDCDNYCKHMSPQPCGKCWSCRARAAITAEPQPGEHK